MTPEQLKSLVFEALAEVAPEADLASLREEVSLRDQLDVDSMDFLNFIIGVHERTGVEIPERDYPRLATVRGIVEYLAPRVA